MMTVRIAPHTFEEIGKIAKSRKSVITTSRSTVARELIEAALKDVVLINMDNVKELDELSSRRLDIEMQKEKIEDAIKSLNGLYPNEISFVANEAIKAYKAACEPTVLVQPVSKTPELKRGK